MQWNPKDVTGSQVALATIITIAISALVGFVDVKEPSMMLVLWMGVILALGKLAASRQE